MTMEKKLGQVTLHGVWAGFYHTNLVDGIPMTTPSLDAVVEVDKQDVRAGASGAIPFPSSKVSQT